MLVCLTACSGGDGGGRQSVRISDVDAAMTKAHTLRYEGDARVGRGPTTQVSGDVDWSKRYVTVRSKAGNLAIVQEGRGFYLQGPTGQWCQGSRPLMADALPSPIATLAALRRSGASLTYVGKEKVRGVTTSHYRLGGSDLDVWVDGQDRLRRLSGTMPQPGTSTESISFRDEFFDFGVQVDATLPPSGTPVCEHA